MYLILNTKNTIILTTVSFLRGSRFIAIPVYTVFLVADKWDVLSFNYFTLAQSKNEMLDSQPNWAVESMARRFSFCIVLLAYENLFHFL